MKTKKLIVLALALSVIAASLAMPAAALSTTIHGVPVSYGAGHSSTRVYAYIEGSEPEKATYIVNGLIAGASVSAFDSGGWYIDGASNYAYLSISVSKNGLTGVASAQAILQFDGATILTGSV